MATKVILPETSYTVTINDDGNYELESPLSLTAGENYTIIFDGTEYKCKAQSFSASVDGVIFNFMTLGGLNANRTSRDISSLAPSDVEITNEPFCYLSMSSSTVTACWICAAYGTHTITITDYYNYLQDLFINECKAVLQPYIRVTTIADRVADLTARLNGTAANIYGVTWAMTADPTMTRTDSAATFSNPTPSVGGSAGSSPFDNLMPWSGMTIVEDETAGTFVAIPKFWYRITKTDTDFQIQIADSAVEGFDVSPAHADRGDGVGERDVVYIARYKFTTAGLSCTGKTPHTNFTRSNLRTALAESLNAQGYYMQDYAMFWTLRLLMVVEYATWDLPSVIGYNCGNNSSVENTGSTDSMPYHTGTIHDSVTTYGVGVQYRWIEDPWGNVFEWVDGWRIDENYNVYVNTNPATYSDTEGGTLVGTLSTLFGWNMGWTVPDVEGMSWALTPIVNEEALEDGTITTGTEYVADFCVFEGPCLFVGGYYGQIPIYGPFCLLAYEVSYSESDVGARLQKLP